MVAHNGQKEPEKLTTTPSWRPNLMKEMPKSISVQSQLHMIYNIDPSSPRSPKVLGKGQFIDWATVLERQKDGTLASYMSQQSSTVSNMQSEMVTPVRETPFLLKRPPKVESSLNFRDEESFEHIHQLYETDIEKLDSYPDQGKIFIGGLSWHTTDEGMLNYFKQFGEVVECQIMRDKVTNATRGFGFVTFLNPEDVKKVFNMDDHVLDGKKIDPQPAVKEISPARSSKNIKRKVFVGGLARNVTLEQLRNYFCQFGKVEDAVLKYDYAQQRHRGFGFVTFSTEAEAQRVIDKRFHIICGKSSECKEAQLKAELDKSTTSTQTVLNVLNAHNLTTEEFSRMAECFGNMKANYSHIVAPNQIRFAPVQSTPSSHVTPRTIHRPPFLHPPPSRPIPMANLPNPYLTMFEAETPPNMNILMQLPYMRQCKDL